MHIVWTPRGILCAILFFLLLGGTARLIGEVFDRVLREFSFPHTVEAFTLLVLVAYGLPIVLDKIISIIVEDTEKVMRAQVENRKQ